MDVPRRRGIAPGQGSGRAGAAPAARTPKFSTRILRVLTRVEVPGAAGRPAAAAQAWLPASRGRAAYSGPAAEQTQMRFRPRRLAS